MVNEYSTEVLVVGGGPAGVSAAFTLGKLGKEVILIDRKPMNLIGDKVCGDALAPEYTKMANDQIGLPRPDPTKDELLVLCDKVELIGKSKGSKITLGSGSATVDRLNYGQALIKSLDQFVSVQVFSETRAKDVLTENNTVVGLICISREKGEITIRSKVVIDASGSSGVVRRRLPDSMCTKFPKKIPKHEMLVSYREIIRTKEPHPYQNGLYLTYEPEIHAVMPGYYWYFSRGEKELNVGLGYMMYEHNMGKNIREINEKVRKRAFPDAEIIKSQGDQIPARLPLPSCVHNGFVASGDAAALVNPLNGEGHGPALLSGIKAGKIVSRALDTNDVSERALWGYNKWIWNEYGILHAWGIAIVKFVNKFGFQTFDWLMQKKILQEDDIIVIINNPEQNINVVKRALKGWYKPKTLLGLRKTLAHAREIQQLSKNYPAFEDFELWNKKLIALENYQI
ncbi:MAG: NAD(P)/FAD-dependent oxidoreductase [Candidatus Kariarchaeaceae archaeon]|jgi:flavin-dependent dehydrogenase